METKFTPGPWKASHWEAASHEVDEGTPFIIQFPGNPDLLTVLHANARLIEAAPNLYKVLAEIYEGLSSEAKKSPNGRRIDYALRKARGETT